MADRGIKLLVPPSTPAKIGTSALGAGTIAGSDSTQLAQFIPGSFNLGINIPVTACDELAVDITVDGVTGAGSISFYYDRLGGDGRWYQVATVIGGAITAVNSSVSSTFGIAQVNASIGTQGRLRWTVAGFTGFTFSASITAK